MTRRSLFGALVALPFVGPLVAKALEGEGEFLAGRAGGQCLVGGLGSSLELASTVYDVKGQIYFGEDVYDAYVPIEMRTGKKMRVVIGETAPLAGVKEFKG